MAVITYALPQITPAPIYLINSKPPRLNIIQLPRPATTLQVVSVPFVTSVYSINQGAYAEYGCD